MRLKIRLSSSEKLVLISLFLFSLIQVVVAVLRLLEIAGGPAIVVENPRAIASPIPMVLHLLSLIPFCYLGAIQFLPSVREHAPQWHRMNGRIVAVAGIVAALSGGWMTHFYTFPVSLQGVSLYVVRMVLSAAMVLFIVLAVRAVKAKRIRSHRAWMIRAYAIGLGASTQAFLAIPWLLITGNEVVGGNRDALMIFAWVLNMLVAERIVRSN